MKIKTAGIVGLFGSRYNGETLASAAAAADILEKCGLEVKKTAVSDRGSFEGELAAIISKYDCAVIVTAEASAPGAISCTLSRLLGVERQKNEAVVALQQKFHHKRGHGRPVYCDQNACIPLGAELFMPEGEAEAGYALMLESAEKMIVLLPGPAFSVARYAEAGLCEFLSSRAAKDTVSCRVNLISCNLKKLAAEAEKISAEGAVSTAIFRSHAETALMISAGSERECKKAVKQIIASDAGDSVYGIDTDLATEIVRLLIKKKKTVSFAESCTGGLIASTLVSVPGSSEVFDGSLVTYANQIKHDFLDVHASTLENDGAVSRKCAQQMAEGARRAMHADYGVAVTGIAGPGGGTDEKPVGLVYIAVSRRGRTPDVHKFVFKGDRTAVRQSTANHALRELYKVIKD